MPRISVLVVSLLLSVSTIQGQVQPSPVDAPAAPEPADSRVEPAPRRVEANVADNGTNGDIYFTSPAGFSTSGIHMLAKASWPSITAKLGDDATTSTFSIFNSSNTRLLTVRGDGRVGVNVTAPAYQLHVVSTAPAGSAFYAFSDTTMAANGTQSDYGALLYGYQDVAAGVANGGAVMGARARGFISGAGTTNTSYGLYAETGVLAAATGTITAAHGVRVKVAKGAGTITTGYGILIDDVEATTAFGVYQRTADDKNYFAGNVGIKTSNPTKALEVVGDAHFTGTVTGGNIKAKYQDVAEWVPSTDDLAPGTVVVLSTRNANEITASSTPYDRRVAGVVSEQPGLLLGEEAPDREQIATTGRVKVRVDARRRAVKIGDLLVTSDVSGTAMVSEPLAISGRELHQPGTILGKALENLDGGIGEVLVLLSLQ